MCLVKKNGKPYCTCPLDSGLILGNDNQTCGERPTCQSDQFECGIGDPYCIPLQWRCDGQFECSDHSDEVNCPECGNGMFRCRNGQCVDATFICDKKIHCNDSSDESNCCEKTEFTCAVR